MSIPMFVVPQGGGFRGSRTTGGKRPIDKLLINISKDGLANSQTQTILTTATFPCTVVGLRWDIVMAQDAGTGNAFVKWAIVVVRDGNAASTLATSDGSDTYTPEQDVMTYGQVAIDNNTEAYRNSGTTKTMRKLMGGDLLIFIALGSATNTVAVRGVVQLFCKT